MPSISFSALGSLTTPHPQRRAAVAGGLARGWRFGEVSGSCFCLCAPGPAFWLRQQTRAFEPGGHSEDCPAVKPRPLTPHGPTPGKSLGQGIDLVVVTPRESKKFGREVFKLRCTIGKPHRTTGEQIGLGNQARALVGFRLILRNVDRTLLEALDKALADRRVLDQQRRAA